MNRFKYADVSHEELENNKAHAFAMQYSMMVYNSNSLYTIIPKNACSSLRTSIAIDNGVINDTSQVNWIHKNNQTFNASLSQAITVDYNFVILRCPYQRLASVFLDKFVSKETDAWDYRERRQRQIELDDLTFREFVRSIQNPGLLRSNIHWHPQNEFLLYSDYSDYFSLEKFSKAIESLREKIGLDVVDTRALLNHGTDRYTILEDKCYSDVEAFDISSLKRDGKCPSHMAMYDEEIYDIVTNLYKKDIALYKEKCDEDNLMKINDVLSISFDLSKITPDDVNHPYKIDYIRDMAISLENSNLERAFYLMDIAHKARPEGAFIAQKLKEYQNKLSNLNR